MEDNAIMNKPILRIESGGFGRNTKLIHIQSGVDLISAVKSIKWNLEGRHPATVTVEFLGPFVDVDLQGFLDDLTIKHIVRDRPEIREARKKLHEESEPTS